ncbi:hypothetical protein PGJ81_15290 [Acinetobacter baumannii]|uniref:hypothetical protein n=1 Tax=Acinetobacter baumannii TaxID=470 RepID=UPI000681C6E6|nr:hypothetical protein [Acinetobacter baumannii]MDA4884624.1 hypothetical protein [Acinetobacter baumannii]MDC4366812.1 hypothetical protein [Acinetobacter baumannii]
MDKKDGDLSFESFKNTNKPNFFGDIEYIYSIFKIKELPVDLLFKILNLVFPDFLIIENHIFLRVSLIKTNLIICERWKR